MYLLAEEIIDGVPNVRFEETNKFDESDRSDWSLKKMQSCEKIDRSASFITHNPIITIYM